MTPTPLELVDPWLGEQIRLISNHKHPTIKSLRLRGDTEEDVRVSIKPVEYVAEKIGRNDPCPWCAEEGIQIKFKKCSIHNK